MRVEICRMCDPDRQTGCPKVSFNKELPTDKQVEISDDFGGRVFLSVSQMANLVKQIKDGSLDSFVS